MEATYQWQASNDLVGVATNLDLNESVSSSPDTSGNPPAGATAVGRMRKVVADTNTLANIVAGDSFRIDVVTVLACEYTGDTKTVTRTTPETYIA
jgi:hypothetical protein